LSANPDLELEQRAVNAAYQALDAMRQQAEAMLTDVLDQGKGGTHQARSERDVIVRTSLARLSQLDLGERPLVFGRIDAESGDSFHVGRFSVSGPGPDPLVVDWRAPAVEPFYRATGRDPMGLRRRRHLQCEGQRVLSVADEVFSLDGEAPPEGEPSEDTVRAGTLLAVLERSRSGFMQDIVATIQREQDEVIRWPLARPLVVQGAPGTGKTAVALHRAAYLLYTHRFPLERQGVLVVGPNQVFLRYVEKVLPALGETGVTLSTLAGLVPWIRVRASEPAALAALKGDGRMARVLARALADRERPLPGPLELGLGARRVRLERSVLARCVSVCRRRRGLHNAKRHVLEALLVQEVASALERSASGAARSLRLERGELTETLRELPEFARALDRMWPRLLPEELLHDLFGAPALIRSASEGILRPEEQRLLLRERSTRLEDVRWSAADVALLDEARALLGPARAGDEPLPAYGHVLVDEAQDLSPMELRMIGRRLVSDSLTLVGDLAQATAPAAVTSWSEAMAYLGLPGADVVELSVNYRTTEQVMAFASALLAEAAPGLCPPRSVRRNGALPVVHHVASDEVVSTVAELVSAEVARSDEGTIGVIVAPDRVEEILGALRGAGLDVERGSAGLLHRVSVLEPVLSKGLEFDTVVVVEPDRLAAPGAVGARLLFTVLTRPTHRLFLATAKPLPPLLEDALAKGLARMAGTREGSG
jgi:DNA helicase IV